MQAPHIFMISAKTLQSIRHMNLALFVNFSIAVFVFQFFVMTHPFDSAASFLLYAILIAGAGAVTWLHHRWTARFYAGQLLIVADKGVYHKHKNAVTRLEHRKITRIVITETEDGEFRELQIISPDKVLKLHGFENMTRAFDVIRTQLDDLVIIRRKRSRLRAMASFWIHIPLSLVAFAIFGLYMYAFPVILIAQYTACVVAALILWAAKPLSGLWGKRVRKWELLFSALILLAVGFGLYR